MLESNPRAFRQTGGYVIILESDNIEKIGNVFENQEKQQSRENQQQEIPVPAYIFYCSSFHPVRQCAHVPRKRCLFMMQNDY